MENTNITLAANIKKYRRKSGFTQEELAAKLGVTYQAVSKWENAKAAPDIFFLPIMADLFGCYIDELFSREVKTELHFDHCAEFPWNDDTTIRGVVCEGKKILQVTDGITDRFTFEIITTGEEVYNVHSECNISVNGAVMGGCNAGGDITVSEGMSGGCNCGGDIAVGGGLTGGCNCGGDITVGGVVTGGCDCCGDITVGGNLIGDVHCDGAMMTVNGDVKAEEIECDLTLTVVGDVEAERIKGDVVCSSVKCERIDGGVILKNA